MLTRKDLSGDIKKIEEALDYVKDNTALVLVTKLIVRVGILGLKLLRDVRTNQTQIMTALGAEKVKPHVSDVVNNTSQKEENVNETN